VHPRPRHPQNREPPVAPAFPQISSTARFSPIFHPAESAIFLFKGCENAAEIICGNSSRKSCAKHAEKRWIFCGFALKTMCRTLRISCGEAADKQRRTAGLTVEGLRM